MEFSKRSGALVALGALALTLCVPAPGFALEGRGAEPETVVMHRLYNPFTGEHFYTAEESERDSLEDAGWVYEGEGWDAPTGDGFSPVYRLYNPHVTGGDHHYTKDAAERDELEDAGWVYEGVGWLSYEGDGIADVDRTRVYRQYNPYAVTGAHNFTTSYPEVRALTSQKWEDEGVAWYGVSSWTPIMGESLLSADELAAYYRHLVGEETYPGDVYAEKGAATIEDFCRILVEEAEAEGVRADVTFFQSMKETGWLRFGGAVKVEWCNFAGLGAVNSNPVDGANRFPDVRTGLRAQIQHLKAYATTEPLVNECVDIRFDLVSRGVAPTLEDLNGRWAVPGNGYGESIASMIDAAVNFSESA